MWNLNKSVGVIDLYTDNIDTSVFAAISRSILETGNNRVLTFHSRSEAKSENHQMPLILY